VTRSALLVTLLLAAPLARAQDTTPTPETRVRKLRDDVADKTAESVGVAELAGVRYPVKPYQEQVSPTFWRGSRLTPDGFGDLKARGFKATVDLTREGTGDAAAAPAAGLATLHLPILDNDHPTDEQMEKFLAFVSDSANQPVYVHCEAGVGRTSIATAVYQMAVLGVPPADALAGAKAHGMKLPNQKKFISRFGAELAAGRIPGYPKQGSP
jgi:protein tyrosine phosphatase (PTP) superfamily phosphohydrolase (DUF442 family)